MLGAQREGEIERKYRLQHNIWSKMMFGFCSFKNKGNVLLDPKLTADMITQLEESQMLISSLKSNKFNKPFKKDIEILDKYLSIIEETVKLWMQNQQNYLYLEAVFQSNDIVKQLPTEAKRFA